MIGVPSARISVRKKIVNSDATLKILGRKTPIIFRHIGPLASPCRRGYDGVSSAGFVECRRRPVQCGRIGDSYLFSSMSEPNPYESPKTDCPATDLSDAPSIRPKIVKAAGGFLRLVGFGVLVGGGLGMIACGVLSDGRAASRFYLAYGLFGAFLGILGSIIGGLVIGILRLATRRKTYNKENGS
jgi:hypothetical protein